LQSKGAQRIQSIKVAQKIRLATFQRIGTQNLQVAKPLILFPEKRIYLYTLGDSQPLNEASPQARSRSFPDATYKALKRRNTREYHLVFNQPATGPLNEMTGSLFSRPTEIIDSPGQAKTNSWRLVKISVSEVVANYFGMAFVRWGIRIEVCFKRRCFRRSIQLAAEVSNHSLRNILSANRESADKSHAAQKGRETYPIGKSSHSLNCSQLRAIKVEVAGQLRWRRRLCITPIRFSLLFRQKVGWHGVRNSKHSHSLNAVRKTKDNFTAKHMCGSKEFCNMFSTDLKVAA